MKDVRVIVSRWTRKLAALALVVLGSLGGWSPANAQGVLGVRPADLRQDAKAGNEIVPTGCAACGSPVLDPPVFGPGGCSGCSGKGCYPGRKPCDCDWEPESTMGRFFHELYTSTCCQDPCYEGCWQPLANSAFFVDQVRPKTQMKLGADIGWDLKRPDKAELFWAQVGLRGPRLPGNAAGARTPGERNVSYQDLYMYTEGATEKFGAFIQMSYRNLDPNTFPGASGFGDMVVGTKSLIFDSDLLQSTFQFKAFLPTGDAIRGLGTGHTALEPSLISATRITKESYTQTQLGVRIPIGGDSQFQGTLLYLGMSYNYLLWNCGTNIQLIGTLEGLIAKPLNGLYTDQNGVAVRARDLGFMFNAGPGVRLVLCKTIDIGLGTSFHITDDSIIGDLVRMEFRWRF